jgi:uncharacterized protein YndB with AHSA1/START domain
MLITIQPFPFFMPKIQRSIEIAASPETVWSIIADPSLIPKMYPDILTSVPDQPGMARVGMKVQFTGKVGGRKVHGSTETTEVEENKRLVVRQLPGGFLKTYVSTFTLEKTNKGTKVSSDVEYEAAAGYLGKALSVLAANRTIRNNILKSLTNLKEIAELKTVGTSTP